ncbi:MAG: NAD(+) synthase [Ruminococcus sp.]|nr:NAD(+) synthase [Ruminococcus sp.]
MKYGFVKVAAATPKIRIADCGENANRIIAMTAEAYKNGAAAVCFPELCVTGYTCSDLFLQKTLLKSAENAVKKIMRETAETDILIAVGTPVEASQSLFNCAAVIHRGRLLGLVPKTNLPNHGEFYETRHFTSGARFEEYISYAGQEGVCLSAKQLFTCEDMPDFTVGVEICEDLWTPSSPSEGLARSGATVILNLSASDEIIGKAAYRRDLVRVQSGKLICAYVYSDAGIGESTTDMVFSGHNIIAENASVLAESRKFSNGITYADIDLERIISERRRSTTFTPDRTEKHRHIFDMLPRKTELSREFRRTPFVPSNKSDLESRCEEILTIQATGLATRMTNAGVKNLVLGLSGGLDSTLALIVSVHAADMLGLDRKCIHAVTMPCFGTTKRTKSNAEKLALAYGADFEEINISSAVRQHFSDIHHNESVTDVTYENAQARERTQVLMDLSNKLNALVVGTGDLSELALGWATYNGDHMSMYAVNASIPKTLVLFLTSYEAQRSEGELKSVLLDVLATPVSPELLPPDKNGEIAQKTEDVVGPYELHDFFLYYFVRFGFSPAKIYLMAKRSFEGAYSPETVKKWLTVFVRRFFTQQFKRSCMPDGPKVGTVALSPRSDWRMPSDASSRAWLENLEELDRVFEAEQDGEVL